VDVQIQADGTSERRGQHLVIRDLPASDDATANNARALPLS